MDVCVAGALHSIGQLLVKGLRLSEHSWKQEVSYLCECACVCICYIECILYSINTRPYNVIISDELIYVLVCHF